MDLIYFGIDIYFIRTHATIEDTASIFQPKKSILVYLLTLRYIYITWLYAQSTFVKKYMARIIPLCSCPNQNKQYIQRSVEWKVPTLLAAGNVPHVRRPHTLNKWCAIVVDHDRSVWPPQPRLQPVVCDNHALFMICTHFFSSTIEKTDSADYRKSGRSIKRMWCSDIK